MPSPKKCKTSYKELGYESVQDCIKYKKKENQNLKSLDKKTK